MPRRNPKKLQLRRPIIIGCGAKRRFRNEKEARAAADLQELRDMQLHLSVYQCHECRKWHLTRQARTDH